MVDPTRMEEAWDAENQGRGWVCWLVRAALAVYLLPALLAALAVGGLALAVGAVVRFLKTMGIGGSPRDQPMVALASRSGRKPHLGDVSRPVTLGRSGREPQPWP